MAAYIVYTAYIFKIVFSGFRQAPTARTGSGLASHVCVLYAAM